MSLAYPLVKPKYTRADQPFITRKFLGIKNSDPARRLQKWQIALKFQSRVLWYITLLSSAVRSTHEDIVYHTYKEEWEV